MFRLKTGKLAEVSDLAGRDIISLFEFARELKSRRARGEVRVPLLEGRTLGLVMAKPSTRTRISFEVAMFELGGHALVLAPDALQISRGETVADTARVFSRYLDGAAVRTFRQEEIVELAANSEIPVINALTDTHHPCQGLTDFFTAWEVRGGELAGIEMAYYGDGNNVCHSLMQAAVLLGARLRVFTPPGREPAMGVLDNCPGPGKVVVSNDPRGDVSGVDFIYTDVWVSMGQEAGDSSAEIFRPYQVNEALLRRAGGRALVMHCLPAHRGQEITSGVIDGQQSLVWDQAENRLHLQKALLAALL